MQGKFVDRAGACMKEWHVRTYATGDKTNQIWELFFLDNIKYVANTN